MIKYELKYINPFNDDRQVLSFQIAEPYQGLSIIQGISDVEDLNLEIEGIEELINRNVSDYSEEGGILYQPILWGSRKSKIAEIRNGEYIGGQEFNTREFLSLCYAWKEFLKNSKNSSFQSS